MVFQYHLRFMHDNEGGRKVIVRTKKELEGLRKIGRIVALTIQEMKSKTEPGMTTKQLDEIGAEVLARYGANSAPIKMYDFPGATCISVNQEAAHGIPGDRVIEPGDVVNIDVSAELDGFYGDAGVSFQVPPHKSVVTKLCKDTEETMWKTIESLRSGMKLNQIGLIIEREAMKRGYYVIRNLCSHGIGRSLHEEPHQIVHFYDPNEKYVLQKGQVLTIEPFFATKSSYVRETGDGWTLELDNGGYVAQFEHTIVITDDKPMIMTLP